MSNTDDQRAAFEAWATVNEPELNLTVHPKKSAWPGEYKFQSTHCAWLAWQAAIEHAKQTMCNRN